MIRARSLVFPIPRDFGNVGNFWQFLITLPLPLFHPIPPHLHPMSPHSHARLAIPLTPPHPTFFAPSSVSPPGSPTSPGVHRTRGFRVLGWKSGVGLVGWLPPW